MEEEFNEQWKSSLIQQILNNKAPEQENKVKVPLANSSWLRMIPQNAHPFVVLVNET
jgi:hypothetical protein